MQIHSSLDPAALRTVIRYHMDALRRTSPHNHEKLDRHNASINILQTRLQFICGDYDVRTPECWRKERGLK